MTNKLPKHIVRLLLLLIVALLVAFAAKIYLTDPSFYRFGHYRADSVPELATGTAVFQGSAYCQTCHEQRNDDWLNGNHRTVQCEVCHGTSEECPVKEGTRIPADTIRLCLTCHEKMPARPTAHPQIVPGEHPFADEQSMPCIECHSPHAPGPVAREEVTTEVESALAESAVTAPPNAKKCAKCHGKQGEGMKNNPALAAVEAARFIEQMNLYRSGAGDSRIMTRFAKALSDEEIAELADYYESLPAPPLAEQGAEQGAEQVE
jgi:cytochrome c553